MRNPQGKLQHFKAGMSVEYADGAEVAEHFEAVDGIKPKPVGKKAVRGKKKEMADK